MTLKLALVFLAVLAAEMGDKTQIAAALFATDHEMHPLWVFAAASLALLCSTALAVLVGHYASAWLESLPLKLIAGVGFIAIGSWSLLEHYGWV